MEEGNITQQMYLRENYPQRWHPMIWFAFCGPLGDGDMQLQLIFLGSVHLAPCCQGRHSELDISPPVCLLCRCIYKSTLIAVNKQLQNLSARHGKGVPCSHCSPMWLMEEQKEFVSCSHSGTQLPPSESATIPLGFKISQWIFSFQLAYLWRKKAWRVMWERSEARLLSDVHHYSPFLWPDSVTWPWPTAS